MKKRKRHGFNGSKRLQSEMQATIAFACYDNDEVLKDGKGMNKNSQMKKIHDLYMPSVPEDKVRMCFVDQFLKGARQFRTSYIAMRDIVFLSVSIVVESLDHC